MLFGVLLENDDKFNHLKQRVDDLEEKFYRQEVDSFIKDLGNEMGVDLYLAYGYYASSASIKINGVFDETFGTYACTNYKNLLSLLRREEKNIKNAIKSYLYDLEKRGGKNKC